MSEVYSRIDIDNEIVTWIWEKLPIFADKLNNHQLKVDATPEYPWAANGLGWSDEHVGEELGFKDGSMTDLTQFYYLLVHIRTTMILNISMDDSVYELIEGVKKACPHWAYCHQPRFEQDQKPLFEKVYDETCDIVERWFKDAKKIDKLM